MGGYRVVGKAGIIRFVCLGLLAGLLAACGGRGAAGGAGAAGLGLRQVAELPLAGGGSRFDYQSLDPAAGRLYIAHLGANLVTVVDTARLQVVADIPDIAQVHGVLAVPDLGRVYATATGDNQLVAIDARTLRVVARAPAGDYPDGLAYDPDTGHLFVSDETGGTVTVVDARTTQRLATIPLGGEAGNTQDDPVGRRVLTAVQSRDQLAAIDPRSDRVVGRYNLPGCRHPHGLALDAPARRAFVACDENATLLVVDLGAMRVVGTQTVGDTPDVLAFDAGLRRLYVAAESGVLAVFAERDGALAKLAQGPVAPAAHSVAVDTQTHRVYLPLAGDRPVLRVLEPQDAGGGP